MSTRTETDTTGTLMTTRTLIERASGAATDGREAVDTIDALGVSPAVLGDIVLRALLRAPFLSVEQIARLMTLPGAPIEQLLKELRANRAVTVHHRGAFDGDIAYELTEAGRHRAEQARQRCQYVGAAPVSIADYREKVAAQDARAPVTRERLLAALREMIVPAELIGQLGAAMNADQPLYLFGGAGSGKSYLAEHLSALSTGLIDVPHAIEVEGEIVQVFDPSVHLRAPITAPASLHDARWVRCLRPVIKVGGEFSVAMMDLEFDAQTRYYKAPVQLKANNGMLLVDDLGRQRDSVDRLLNRWIVPLERRVDFLQLHTGVGVEVPFAVKAVFSSNLSPAELGDPAFLRRLGYKLPITQLRERDYCKLVMRACEARGVVCNQEGLRYLVRTLHATNAIPMMAAYAGALVGKVADRCAFENLEPILSIELVDWAWQVEFAAPISSH